ncbi:MAG: sulfurtransferase TusA family protein [Thermoplasmata archaeon]|jgi:TusA-related sulfurtransferase
MSADELKRLKVDKVADAREIPCPGPLLEAKRAMQCVPMAGVIEVISSDIGTTLDIPVWAEEVGHEYLGMIKEPGIWRLYVRRAR